METIMKGYEYQSDFAKKYVAEGRIEGRIEGRTEGRIEGRTEGRAEGRAEEAALSLLAVLRARGIAVPDAIREHILAQKEPERLRRWLERAVVADSIAAILDEPS
jgi:predicted transposase YdaD